MADSCNGCLSRSVYIFRFQQSLLSIIVPTGQCKLSRTIKLMRLQWSLTIYFLCTSLISPFTSGFTCLEGLMTSIKFHRAYAYYVRMFGNHKRGDPMSKRDKV